MHIGDTPTLLAGADFVTLSKKTEGYSCVDIFSVVRKALMMPIHKVQLATHYKTTSGPSPSDPGTVVDDLLTPCGPRDPGATEMSWMQVPKDKLLEPKVSLSDFLKAQSDTRPTISTNKMKLFEQFTLEFGQ